MQGKTEIPPHNNTQRTIEDEHVSMKIFQKKSFVLMGIVNVTPDSFYDGGNYATYETALYQAKKLISEGADILDIGGESSRPGALPVSIEQEKKRIIPLITALRKDTDIPLSIDTTKADVAQAALSAGATWINDISAGRFDDQMISVIVENQCPIILMHSRKTPTDMQVDPKYGNVTKEVVEELYRSIQTFIEKGVSSKNIIVDPGIGFAKRFEDNLSLLKNLKTIIKLKFPVLIGTSRKSFIGQITGKKVDHRLYGTLGSVAAAYNHGARFFRVHDVAETKDLLSVLTTIENYQ